MATEFTVPTASSQPFSITAGPDGALWFTEVSGNKIGRISTGGAITEFTASGNPGGITAGSDGNLWFTEIGGNNIDRMTTGGAITRFAIPTASSVPHQIVAGPDGNLWFTEIGTGKIGRITTGGAITEFSIPTSGGEPFGIAPGPDGNLWFTEIGTNKVGRITTSGSITEFTVGQNPAYIVTGADGALWFTESDTEVSSSISKIGRITTSGTFTQFTPPTSASFPQGITAGPDGAIWFTEEAGNKIGRVTENGTFSEFSLSGGSQPFEVVNGSDGTLWITEFGGNKIGELTPSLPAFDTSWTFAGIGDFNGSSKPDLVWRQASTGLTEFQFQNGLSSTALNTPTNNPFDATWSVAAIGDVNGDGNSDIVWRRQTDGVTEVQLLSGNQTTGGGAIANNPFDQTWSIAGLGNFSGTGKNGLVWRQASSSLTEIQFLSGNTATGGGLIANNPFVQGWNVVGIGDFTNNGKDDLVWQQASSGLVEIQLMNGSSAVGGGVIANNPFGQGWSIVATGDFTGTGTDDLVWQRASDGLTEIQFLNGNTATGGGAISNNPFDTSWSVVGASDFNGDGKSDLVWRQASSGITEVQFLNGTQATGGGVVATGGTSPITNTQVLQLAQNSASLPAVGTSAATSAPPPDTTAQIISAVTHNS